MNCLTAALIKVVMIVDVGVRCHYTFKLQVHQVSFEDDKQKTGCRVGVLASQGHSLPLSK